MFVEESLAPAPQWHYLLMVLMLMQDQAEMHYGLEQVDKFVLVIAVSRFQIISKVTLMALILEMAAVRH